MNYQLHQVPVDGGLLSVGVWGDQDATLNILAPHGITANHTCWHALSKTLPDARIIAPDLRGRGRSNQLSAPFGLMQHAKDLNKTLEFFGVEKAIVVGHSMGGFVSVRFAANFPEKVSGLVLVDGGLPLERPAGVDTEDLVSATLGPAAERLARVFSSRAEYQDFWMEHPAFKENFNTYVMEYVDYDLDQQNEGFRPSSNIESVEADIRELFGADEYLEEMSQISVSTTFMRAPRGLLNDAPLYDSDLSKHSSDRFSGLRVVEVSDVNHYTIVLSDSGSGSIRDEIMNLANLTRTSQETP